MKILGLAILWLFIFSLGASAQDEAAWSLSSEAKGKELKSGEKFTAKLKATLQDDWHLYAIDQPDGGPIPTTIKPAEEAKFILDGGIKSPEPITKFDPLFDIDTRFFAKEAEFTIPLKSLAVQKGDDLAVNVRFQLCNSTLCLPPKTLKVSFSGVEGPRKSNASQSSDSNPGNLAVSDGSEDVWAFLWLAVTVGALSLLTPCVFPMIPITVSYFTHHSDGSQKKSVKLALVYSLGIIATFTVLGMLLALFIGAAGINLFAANPWVNILITAIFLFFAFNLFGAYEITIPNSLLTKLDALTRSKEGEGSGMVGALLMGLTFTLTSFTCTSPFVGTILVSTAQGNWKMPLLGMLAFSSVFALPFFILALAPRLLHSLPKSGGWLNSVKVAMGFLEIAAALKFLSNVDLVWKWGIFTREVVLILWVLIALALALYVLGFFRFKLDSPIKGITAFRAALSVGFVGMAIYLSTGVLGMRLGELESFLPPKNADSRFNILGNKSEELAWIENDLEAALKKAKLENRKVFVDFTGYTCTNCRWMETNMFPLPEVRKELAEYSLSKLYTDGEGAIYEKQQQYEEKTFGTTALPLYAILDAEGKPVATFAGMTRSQEEFIEFLKKGK